MKTSFAVALLLTIGGTIGYAQQERRSYVYGHGQNSCGQYLQAAHNHAPGRPKGVKVSQVQYYDEHYVYLVWFMGYVTALTMWMGDIVADTAAIDVWLRKWCEQNPTKDFFVATDAYIRENHKEALKTFEQQFWQKK